MTGNAAAHFSRSYGEARAKFLAACEAAHLPVESIAHPSARGPEGETLYCDVARAGASGPGTRLTVVSSGTHGVEGFCGSGCQTAMLTEGLFADLPADAGALLVHALNPFGFAHRRRVNEDNVDLNRNFIDHAAGHPDNPGYAAIHELIAPADLAARRQAVGEAIFAWIGEHGLEAFQAAVSGGQYQFPDGLFYGGQAPVWSNAMWRGLIEKEMAEAACVTAVDIHTGLGPYGHGEMIGLGDGAAVARARAIWGGAVTDLAGGGSVSAVVSGDVSTPLFATLGERGVPVAAIGLEFGTKDAVTVLQALQIDNWLYMYGDPAAPDAEPIKQEVLGAFYADDPAWQEPVAGQARQAVKAAIDAQVVI